MGRLAYRVVHVEIAPDRAHHHLTGVQSNADLDRHALVATHAFGVPLHGLLHAQGGIARADCVILVGHGCPEERHDPVAHHLIHRALVAMDGLHHSLEDRIENLARFLGIAIGEELHGALEVGEEDRDLLALALERGFRREDLLGEMLRGVGLGRGEARLSWRFRRHRCPAPVAELRTGW